MESSAPGHYEEIESKPSPILQETYLFHKTLVHKVTELTIVCDALIQDNITRKVTHQYLESIEDDLIAILGTLKNKKCLNESTEVGSYIKMIQRSIGHIHQTKSCQELTAINQLCYAYLDDMKPYIRDYGQKSVKTQLEGIHEVITAWSTHHDLRSQHSATILAGPKGSREYNIETQYFVDWYAKNGILSALDKDYVMYVESPDEQMLNIRIPDLVRSYSKHLLNKKIGLMLLGDNNAMKKDILAEFAPDVLQQIAPVTEKKRSGCPVEAQNRLSK